MRPPLLVCRVQIPNQSTISIYRYCRNRRFSYGDQAKIHDRYLRTRYLPPRNYAYFGKQRRICMSIMMTQWRWRRSYRTSNMNYYGKTKSVSDDAPKIPLNLISSCSETVGRSWRKMSSLTTRVSKTKRDFAVNVWYVYNQHNSCIRILLKRCIFSSKKGDHIHLNNTPRYGVFFW